LPKVQIRFGNENETPTTVLTVPKDVLVQSFGYFERMCQYHDRQRFAESKLNTVTIEARYAEAFSFVFEFVSTGYLPQLPPRGSLNQGQPELQTDRQKYLSMVIQAVRFADYLQYKKNDQKDFTVQTAKVVRQILQEDRTDLQLCHILLVPPNIQGLNPIRDILVAAAVKPIL
jgi:hypothetical protein